MSGIFGLLNRAGQPVKPEHLDAMGASLAYAGFHSSPIWRAETIGLGHLLCNTPEDEVLPRHDPASGIVLTAQARLDNHDELISNFRFLISDSAPQGGCALSNGCFGLGDDENNRPSKIQNSAIGTPLEARKRAKSKIPDSDLILHAYLKWGEACVHHLLGDWAFALWDPRERKLFLARDHHGISSIYYYHHPRFFAFASSIKALLTLPDVSKRPNLFRIAQVLTSWPGDGVQTAYEEIFRLPPAHTLTITGNKVEVRRYWHLENVPSVRLSSDQEYLEAFLELYTQAVRCRLRSPLQKAEGLGERFGIGATLSSGLDSGSVCALAARELGAVGERLPVFTSVPIYDTKQATPRGRYGDELPLVEINRQFIGNLDIYPIRAENVSPLAGMERMLEIHDSPGHAAGNAFWLISILQTAQQQGLGVLLTGQIGNGTISWMGGVENLWPLLLSGQWRTLVSKSKVLSLPLWKIVRRHFLRPLLLPLHDQIRRYRTLGREPWAASSAINANFARSLDLTRQMAASGHNLLFMPPSDPFQARLHILKPGASIVGATWAEIGARYGLEVRDPTMDKRLIEFCLAIPDEQYRREGQDRWLLRRAMKGLLPDEVRLNPRKGLQAADLGHRLLVTLPDAQAMMRRLEQSALAREVLDLPKMNSVLQALQKEVNATTTWQCMTILTRGMMAGMFLLRF